MLTIILIQNQILVFVTSPTSSTLSHSLFKHFQN